MNRQNEKMARETEAFFQRRSYTKEDVCVLMTAHTRTHCVHCQGKAGCVTSVVINKLKHSKNVKGHFSLLWHFRSASKDK